MATLYIINLAVIAFALPLAVYVAASEQFRQKRAAGFQEAKRQMGEELTSQIDIAGVTGLAQHFATEKLSRQQRSALESLLLGMLEKLPALEGASQSKKRRWQATLAYRLKLPQSALALLSSRRDANIAKGARKAGLYRMEQASGLLVAAASSRSGQVQAACLIALARLGSEKPFLEALKRLCGRRRFAPYVLDEVFCEYTGDIPSLYGALLSWEGGEISLRALKSMPGLAVSAHLEKVLAYTQDADMEVRIAALNALGRLSAAPAEYFKRALDDAEWQVRSAACRLLGRHISLSCGILLLHAISDLSWWVRQNAAASVLSYIEFNEHLLTQFNFRDPYALSALRFACEKAGKTALLEKLNETAANILAAKQNNIYYITYKTDRDQSMTATLIDI